MDRRSLPQLLCCAIHAGHTHAHTQTRTPIHRHTHTYTPIPSQLPCEFPRVPAAEPGPKGGGSQDVWPRASDVRPTGGGDTAGDSREWGPCATVIRPRASMNTALSEPTPRGDHGTRGSVGLRRRTAGFLAFWLRFTLKQILVVQSPQPCAWGRQER